MVNGSVWYDDEFKTWSDRGTPDTQKLPFASVF